MYMNSGKPYDSKCFVTRKRKVDDSVINQVSLRNQAVKHDYFCWIYSTKGNIIPLCYKDTDANLLTKIYEDQRHLIKPRVVEK